MIRTMVRLATVVLLGMVVAGLVGCGPDVRNDPWIVEKFKEIDGQIAKSKELPGKVQDLNEDVVSLRDEIGRLKGVGGATSTSIGVGLQIRTLSQKLADLEARIQTLEAAVKGRPTATLPPKATPVAAAPTPAPVVTPAPIGPKTTPMALRTTPVVGATTKTARVVKPSVAPGPGTVKATTRPISVAPPSEPRGDYYTAVEGDTIRSIMAKFKITAEEFHKANTFVRPGSEAIPGERYWIPRGKK